MLIVVVNRQEVLRIQALIVAADTDGARLLATEARLVRHFVEEHLVLVRGLDRVALTRCCLVHEVLVIHGEVESLVVVRRGAPRVILMQTEVL